MIKTHFLCAPQQKTLFSILLVATLVALAAQAFFVFAPLRNRLFDEAVRVAAILSMLPHEINVGALFQRALAKNTRGACNGKAKRT